MATVQTWNAPTNILTVTNINGEFIDTQAIVGATSNTSYVLSSYNPLKDSTRNEVYDNMYIENQANNILDFTEINPFGRI